MRELKEINNLLYAFNYEALHVRSVDDLCYYFALIHGIPYDEAEQGAKEETEKFESIYGKEAGESKRKPTGLYTKIVLDKINLAHTWKDLEDYIEENRAKLGKIKITAYKRLKEFAEELEEYDKARLFEKSDNELLHQKLVDNIRKSMGCPMSDKKSGFSSMLNRSESIGRGVYIMYFIKRYFDENKHNIIDSQRLTEELNNDLDKCSFATVNPQRCLWDKIVCDSIDASLELGLWYDDEINPYYLLNVFLDYIQSPEN